MDSSFNGQAVVTDKSALDPEDAFTYATSSKVSNFYLSHTRVLCICYTIIMFRENIQMHKSFKSTSETLFWELYIANIFYKSLCQPISEV